MLRRRWIGHAARRENVTRTVYVDAKVQGRQPRRARTCRCSSPMSHIFDALQRSEAERTGIAIRAFSAATELLQIAEREAAVRVKTEVQAEPAVQAETVADRKASLPLNDVLSTPAAPESPEAAEPSTKKTSVDQLSQFQSLRVLVPPQGRLVCLTDKESLAAEKFRFLVFRLRQLQHSRCR